MIRTILKRAIKALSCIVHDDIGHFYARLFSKKLITQIEGFATDKFLELLLAGMDLVFHCSKGFRQNLAGFTGSYVFRTGDGLVAASALFSGRTMKVIKNAVENWDVRVDFKNAEALRKFLFSKDQDILNSILASEVEVKGNLNLIYKFAFMARDLARRIGGR
jgi:hypothetical protein